MTTQKLSVALLGVAFTLALGACGGGGPTEAECQAPNITDAMREACLDAARDQARDYFEEHPEENTPAAPTTNWETGETWEPID